MKEFNYNYCFKKIKTEKERIKYIKDRIENKVINWNEISRKKMLSEGFIREFEDKVNWDYIPIFQTLSEDFIREFKDKVDWYSILRAQKLSEDFIREFKDKVDWICISKFQILSNDFRKEFNLFIIRDFSYNKDIKPLKPCKEGVKRYLSHTKANEIISWNTFLERHKPPEGHKKPERNGYKNDISWLYMNFYNIAMLDC